MGGLGHVFLKQSFDALCIQTFKDFDIVVSDHSWDDLVKNLCDEYRAQLDISYCHNAEHRGSSSANINNAIRHATGELIKILFQDDFLYHGNALQDIADAFDMTKDHWLVTACIHTKNGIDFFRPFHPRYNKRIYLGNNTISSPSVLTIRNDHPLLFDEALIWLMDVEYYKRLYDAFGDPKIVNIIGVVNRVGSHQVSNTLANKVTRGNEYLLMLRKYEKGLDFWYYRGIGFIKSLIK